MKTYIWQYVAGITDNWHDGGGVLIITSRFYNDAWKEYVDKYQTEKGEYENDIECKELPDPDLSYECSASEEKVFVFEDAGCC